MKTGNRSITDVTFRYFAGVLLWVTIACPQLSAQLAFSHYEKITDVVPGQTSYEAKFTFKNAGQDRIRILKVQTSCGCTTAKLSKFEYAPGESGEIRAKIFFGEARGLYVKKIYIYTHGGGNKVYILKIGGRIPQYATINPRALVWRKGESAKEKTSVIELNPKYPVQVIKAVCKDPKWKFRLEKESQTRVLLHLRPVDTETGKQTTVSLLTNWPANNPLVFQVVGRVSLMPSPPKESMWIRFLRWLGF